MQKQVRKNYVLDCTVLVFDPKCILAFHGNNVIIPNSELRHLERLTEDKKEMVRYQAKVALNFINHIRSSAKENENHGFVLEKDIVLYIFHVSNVSNAKDSYENIFETMKKTSETFMEDRQALETILVSRTLSLRIAALANGYKAEDYKAGMIFADNTFKGVMEVSYKFFDMNSICSNVTEIECPKDLEVYPNQYLVIVNESGKKIATYRVAKNTKILKRVDVNKLYNKRVYGVKPLNDMQAYAIDLLLDPEVECVSLSGTAGTGKTFLSVAAALQQTIPKDNSEPRYNKIIFVRPMVAAGEEMGFIPGTVIEKLIPWMGSLYDAIEVLVTGEENLENDKKNQKISASKMAEKFIEEQMENGFLQLSPTTYMRGRTFERAFVIIDEAQGITPHIMKTILTRKGGQSKIVIAGDPSDNQIDTELLDTYYNGLIYASQGLKESKHSGLVEFTPKNIVRSNFVEDVEAML
ncbi:MAG: PhoH family protein [Clostridia bacterium]|nr:PhoH family protein [Clostridia bacterium]